MFCLCSFKISTWEKDENQSKTKTKTKTNNEIGKLFLDAGAPPGVFNVITGYGPSCGKYLVEHPHIQGIAFTGSTLVGQKIAEVFDLFCFVFFLTNFFLKKKLKIKK